MASRQELEEWLVDALNAIGGRGSPVRVCKEIWEQHHGDLQQSGNLLYTWQYDVRWAANQLRHRHIMKSVEQSARSVWELVPESKSATAAEDA